MDWPEPFPHMVDCKHVRYTGQLVEQIVFEAKQGSWPDNGCLREQLTGYSFTLCLNRGQLPVRQISFDDYGYLRPEEL